MKVYVKILETKIDMVNTKANVLVLENPKTYRDVVQDLLCSIIDDNEQWIFSEDEKILKKNATLDVVDSIFSLNFDNRKIQKAVVENLYNVAIDEEHYEKTTKLMNEIEAYIYELEWGVEYNIEASYEDFHNVIKAGVSGILLPENLLEKFNEYIKIASRLLKTKVLILIGVQGFFSQEEWREIEMTACYEEVYLFCLENHDYFSDENKVVFDLDNCRVV